MGNFWIYEKEKLRLKKKKEIISAFIRKKCEAACQIPSTLSCYFLKMLVLMS